MKHLLAALLLSAATLGAAASPLTPTEAFERVSDSRFKAPGAITLAYTQASDLGASCYVFNRDAGKGYMVLSADDTLPVVLGYSAEGSFDADNIPANMRWWLESYQAEIDAYKQSPRLTAGGPQRPEREPIAPMVKAHWDQHEPYNLHCPMQSGFRTIAGCVAIAMAQIMYYHQWPLQGEGSISYLWQNQTLDMDFSEQEFSWNDILPLYSSNATEKEKESVASLVYAVALAIKTDFGLYASGAPISAMGKALFENFGYDAGMYTPDRDAYGLIDWENLIYSQLQQGMPVLYTGFGGGEGHAFVCDGYSSDGYFHINWGWGSLSDGYFLLSALEPDKLGAGAGKGSYNYSQSALVGIRKPTAENTPTPFPLMATFGVASKDVIAGENILIDEGVYNFSTACKYYELGLKFESENTTVYAPGWKGEIAGFDGIDSWEVEMPAGMEDDTRYTVSPVFRDGDEWKPMKVYLSGYQSAEAVTEGGMLCFMRPERILPEVSEVEFTAPLYAQEVWQLECTLTNLAGREYYAPVRACLLDMGGKVLAYSEAMEIDLLDGESTQLAIETDFNLENGEKPEPGKYLFALAVENGYGELEALSEPWVILVLAEGDKAVEITDFNLYDIEGLEEHPAQIRMEFDVQCLSDDFQGRFTVTVADNEGNKVEYTTSETALTFGKTATLAARGEFPLAQSFATYTVTIYMEDAKILNNEFNFATGDLSEIKEQQSECATKPVWYSLDGIRVARPSKAGIYLMTEETVLGKFHTLRILKK